MVTALGMLARPFRLIRSTALIFFADLFSRESGVTRLAQRVALARLLLPGNLVGSGFDLLSLAIFGLVVFFLDLFLQRFGQLLLQFFGLELPP